MGSGHAQASANAAKAGKMFDQGMRALENAGHIAGIVNTLKAPTRR